MADDKKKAEKGGGEAGSKPVSTEQLTERFKKTFGFDPEKLLQPGAQVFTRKAAEYLGKRLRKSFKDDSFLRGDLAEFLGYCGVAVVESDQKSTIRRVIGEFLAAFIQTFCGGEGEDHTRTEKKTLMETLPSELQIANGEVDAAWIKWRDEIIRTAKTSKEVANVDKYLEDIGRVRWKAKQLELYGPEKTSDPKVPGIPLRERLETVVKTADAGIGKFNAELAPHVVRLQTKTAELKQKRVKEKEQRAQTSFKARLMNILGWILWK